MFGFIFRRKKAIIATRDQKHVISLFTSFLSHILSTLNIIALK